MNAHDRIWLIDMGDCVCWSEEPNPTDLDEENKPASVEYIRANTINEETKKLKGAFRGCPHHDDDYEACIQYSGTAPCGVEEERDALAKRLNDEDFSHNNTMEQRDHAETMADNLSAAIMGITGRDIGEHSSANCPWSNAFEHAEEYEAERDALARMQKFVLLFASNCSMSDTDDCIEWQGNKDAKGYGRINGHGGTVKAHRLSYCLHAHCSLESISSVVVRHTCDNPSCVNPRHLLTGSNLDNIADRFERGRSAKGEANGWSKLTGEEVAQIKAFYQKGVRGRGAVSTAKRFNVCHSTVQRIISGERWAHHEDA